MEVREPSVKPFVASRGRSQALAALWGLLAQASAGDPRPVRHAGGAAPFPVFNSSAAHRLIKQGIPSLALGPLGDYLGLGKGVVAEYLDLDRGTANRRAARGLLLPLHSAEGVLRLLELDQMAMDTFEDEEASSQWLRRPHPMLDGETPLESAKTSYGTQRVKDILLAIQYGGVV